MAGRAVGAVGAGLLVAGSYVCWLGWTAGDALALIAGGAGVGLGGTGVIADCDRFATGSASSARRIDHPFPALLAIVSAGLWELPAILLALKLNVFAIPLALAGALEFSLWVWYCIALMWVSQALYYTGTDVPGALERVRVTSVSVPIGVVTEPIPDESHEQE